MTKSELIDKLVRMENSPYTLDSIGMLEACCTIRDIKELIKNIENKCITLEEEYLEEDEAEEVKNAAISTALYKMNLNFAEFLELFSEVFIDVINLEEEYLEEDEYGDEYERLEQSIVEAIERISIYTENCWKILKHYTTPMEANWEQALESLSDDLHTCYSYYMEEVTI